MNKRPFQKQFELEVLFDPPGIPIAPGALETKRDKTYMLAAIEYAYAGYAMARTSELGRAARVAPDRFIGPALRADLQAQLGHEVDEATIRAVLAVAAAHPA